MNFDSEGRVTDSLITADIVRRKVTSKLTRKKHNALSSSASYQQEKRSRPKDILFLLLTSQHQR
jgi:hypothetical protein